MDTSSLHQAVVVAVVALPPPPQGWAAARCVGLGPWCWWWVELVVRGAGNDLGIDALGRLRCW
jgi:hypothetical protein